MTSLRKLFSIGTDAGKRGSALLVSLMVMVGLSLLGLGFVAISETESAIATNERNATQVLNVAETGARTVVEWFNRPQWALKAGLMPANTDDVKQERQATVPAGTAGATSAYTGFYKDTAGTLLFDLPYKPFAQDRFYGVDEVSADIVINRDTASAFLDTFNERLFRDNVEGGRVTEILVYAPPVLNPGDAGASPAIPTMTTIAGPPDRRYWNLGTRYGVATIKVTAQKTTPANCTPGVDTPCSLVAQRSVKLVIAEFPFPGPEGPLQSNSGITTNGAFRVHWGKVISLGDLALKRDMVGLPWLNAWEPARYEWGYSTSYDFMKVGVQPDYFNEMLNKQIEDPWFQARARGDITTDDGSVASVVNPCTGCQPNPYDTPNDIEGEGSFSDPTKAGWSNEFQGQTSDFSPERKQVLFPSIDYKFWKQVAVSATGQSGIYYLQWDPVKQEFFDRAGNSKTFGKWVNTMAGAKEGFYFFDTNDGSNPQRPDGTTDTTKLTPAIDLNAGDTAGSNPNATFCAKGFIYLNALNFGSQGIKGKAGFYNAPGEPFRDVGYHAVDKATGNLRFDAVTGNPILVNNTNYLWDYQDLNDNDKFDYFMHQPDITPPGSDSPPLPSEYRLKLYFNGCTVGTDCSEPHEPFLNIIYPATDAIAAGGDPNKMLIRWHAKNNAAFRRPKVFQSDGVTPVVCDASSTPEECTDAGYDKIGGLLRLGTNAADGPILDGVFYNEGGYDSTGNAIYYGSVVVRGVASKAGTIDVFFDDRLVTGGWQERFKNLARVLITSHETD